MKINSKNIIRILSILSLIVFLYFYDKNTSSNITKITLGIFVLFIVAYRLINYVGKKGRY